jgi:hypothetical protein
MGSWLKALVVSEFAIRQPLGQHPEIQLQGSDRRYRWLSPEQVVRDLSADDFLGLINGIHAAMVRSLEDTAERSQAVMVAYQLLADFERRGRAMMEEK